MLIILYIFKTAMPSSKGLSNNLRITPYYIDTLNYLKNKRNSVFLRFLLYISKKSCTFVAEYPKLR